MVKLFVMISFLLLFSTLHAAITVPTYKEVLANSLSMEASPLEKFHYGEGVTKRLPFKMVVIRDQYQSADPELASFIEGLIPTDGLYNNWYHGQIKVVAYYLKDESVVGVEIQVAFIQYRSLVEWGPKVSALLATVASGEVLDTNKVGRAWIYHTGRFVKLL